MNGDRIEMGCQNPLCSWIGIVHLGSCLEVGGGQVRTDWLNEWPHSEIRELTDALRAAEAERDALRVAGTTLRRAIDKVLTGHPQFCRTEGEQGWCAAHDSPRPCWFRTLHSVMTETRAALATGGEDEQ